MVKSKKLINKLTDKLNVKIRDYINDFSLPRQFFKFEQDEIPANVTSKTFNKVIPIEEFQNNFYSIAHRLCIEVKLFEDNYFIDELDKASKIENNTDVAYINIISALAEAKQKVDRWDNVTTSHLINYMNFKEVKKAFDSSFTPNQNGKYNAWGAEIIFDLNIPINYIYAISHHTNNYCAHAIWENFGAIITDDEKNIELFNKIAIVIDKPQNISRVSYKTQD